MNNNKTYDIVILGAKESGTGAALLAKHKKLKVFVSDKNKIPTKYKKELQKHNIEYEEKKHTIHKILSTKEIVKSPGIPNNTPLIQQIKNQKITIIDEVELAHRYTNAKFIAITGTNGKTTTTLLTHHITKQAKLNTSIAGNIGKSIARQIIKNKHQYYIIELSSYQLENIKKFKPHIAIILNITPNHLEQHNNNLNQYIKAKLNIINNMNKNDTIIYNKDDTITQQNITKHQNQHTPKHTISTQTQNAHTHLNTNKNIQINTNTQTIEIPNKNIIPGKHNIINTMAATTTATILKINKHTIIKALNTFKTPKHRIQYVTTINQIKFYNDSKATTTQATHAALNTFKNPIIWIAGGQDKNNNYNNLHKTVKKK